MENANSSSMYDRLMDYQKQEHLRNRKKLRIGMILLWAIPLTFLFLMFVSPESNKIIFLVLWIVSLFAIAVYLIIVEYRDYNLQKSIQEISGDKDADVSSLINPEERREQIEEEIEERIEDRKEKIEGRIEDRKEKIEGRIEDRKEKIEEQKERIEGRIEDRKEKLEEKVDQLKKSSNNKKGGSQQ